MAMWHHPRFSSGEHGNDPKFQPLWQALYDWGADIILNGHNHNYERLGKMNEWGNASSRGVREFIAGTGGEDHETGRASAQTNSQAYQDTSFGILELTLHPNSYEWNFRSARPSGSGAPWNPNYDDPAEGSVAQCNN
jgi:hypothetical protein